MRLRLAALAALMAMLAGCAYYSNHMWTGTFTYEGLEYPVFVADQEVAGETSKVYMLYLPGKKPGDNPGLVKVCDKPDLNDCKPEFGAAIRDRFEPKPQRDESMGY